MDANGCSASQRDADGDGVSELDDFNDYDPTQSKDTDNDGYGDNASGTDGDACQYTAGTSTVDRFGCLDTDGDGFSDPDSTWTFSDGADRFQYEDSQWADSDDDGYGDNWGDSSWNDTRDSSWPGVFVSDAYKPDRCPTQSNSYALSYGCPEGVLDTGDDNSEVTDNTASQSKEDGNTMLIIVGVVGAIVVLGLIGAIMMLLKKPDKKKSTPKKWDLTSDVESEEKEPEEVEENTEQSTENWAETWEGLPPGGEYTPPDENGTVWYNLPSGEYWYQNSDDSWSLWDES